MPNDNFPADEPMTRLQKAYQTGYADGIAVAEANAKEGLEAQWGQGFLFGCLATILILVIVGLISLQFR